MACSDQIEKLASIKGMPAVNNGAGVYTSAADAAKAFVASCKAGGGKPPCVNPSAPAKGGFYCAVYYNTPAKILGEPPYLVPRGGGVRNAAGKFCPNVPFWC